MNKEGIWWCYFKHCIGFSGVNKNAQLWLRAINNVRNPRWCIKFSCLISVNIGRSLMCNRRIIAHLVFLPPSIILNHRESFQCVAGRLPANQESICGCIGLDSYPKTFHPCLSPARLASNPTGSGLAGEPSKTLLYQHATFPYQLSLLFYLSAHTWFMLGAQW